MQILWAQIAIDVYMFASVWFKVPYYFEVVDSVFFCLWPGQQWGPLDLVTGMWLVRQPSPTAQFSPVVPQLHRGGWWVVTSKGCGMPKSGTPLSRSSMTTPPFPHPRPPQRNLLPCVTWQPTSTWQTQSLDYFCLHLKSLTLNLVPIVLSWFSIEFLTWQPKLAKPIWQPRCSIAPLSLPVSNSGTLGFR